FRFMQDCSPDIQQFDNLFKSYKLSDETGCLCFGLSKLSLARQMIRQFCSADGKKRSKLYTGLQADLVKAPELTTSSSLVVFDITVPKSVSTDNLSSMDMT
ncbi:hypothetical protein HID58_042033, partial [Brassica napus]